MLDTCHFHVPIAQPHFSDSEQSFAPELFDSLEVQAVMIQHLEWCVQFNDYLCQIRPGAQTPIRTLPGADSSQLGRWLKLAATRGAGRHPKFGELLYAHCHFHALAEEVILLAEEDRMDLASRLLESDFERDRTRLLHLLREIQKDQPF